MIGITIWSICIVFFTYAWYNWRSDNTNVSLKIKENALDCTSGPNVNVENIGPVLNPEVDGVKATFQVASNSTTDNTFVLSLNITKIDNNLLTESFKYQLLADTTGGTNYSTEVLTGNFSKFHTGSNLIGSSINVEAGKTYSYQFIVYIDGNMKNPNTMQGLSMKSSLTICDKFYLSFAEPGSYVAYTGNNGCTGEACNGQNANYVSDTNMGYCGGSGYKFNVNGWRVGYVKDNTAYLVSAGSPECLCTNSDGTTSNSSCSTYEKTGGAPQHLANLNNRALKYCNADYAYGGVCNSTSSWNMNATDFQNITGSPLSINSCYMESNSVACGYGNTLIDNGSYYWYATSYTRLSYSPFFWYADFRLVRDNYSSHVCGTRPVLRLASSVVVTGGTGTYEDPYTIENKPLKLSEVESGSYVAYTGNNGCTGESCNGQNANYVSDTNMGYCYNSSYKFQVNGWRVGYIKDDTAYLVSAGSPECLCTNEDGTTSNSSCSTRDTMEGALQHLANLNNVALKYCNTDYAYGGACNSSSSWNMNVNDFQNITGSPLSESSCYWTEKSTACGYGNNLIDIGSFYWYATPYTSSDYNTFRWNAINRSASTVSSNLVYGSRPVLRLASSVLVTGGSGTYEDPYKIVN